MAFRNPLTSNPMTSFPASELTGFIQGSQLAADAIDGKTITGATIQTAAYGTRWVMDSVVQDEIRGYTGSGAETGPGLLGISLGFGLLSTFLRSPQTVGGIAFLNLESRYTGGTTSAYLQADTITLAGAVSINGVASAQTQSGSVTLPTVFAAGSASGTVYFPAYFAGAPNVTLTSGSGRLTCSVSAVASNSFSYVINNWSPAGAPAGAALYWIATL